MKTTPYETQPAVQTGRSWSRLCLLGVAAVVVSVLVVTFVIGAGGLSRNDSPFSARDAASHYVSAVLKADGSHKKFELEGQPKKLQEASDSIYRSADWSWLKASDGYRLGEVWGAATGGGRIGSDLNAFAVPWREKSGNGSSRSEGTLIWMIVHLEIFAKNGDRHSAMIAMRPAPDSPVIRRDPDRLHEATEFTKWSVVPIPEMP